MGTPRKGNKTKYMTRETACRIMDIDAQIEWRISLLGAKMVTLETMTLKIEIERLKEHKLEVYDNGRENF